jgi:zinc transporter ZupT
VRQRQAIRVGRQFYQHIIPAIVKPAHALWNEVIGFIFLCLGAIFGFYAVRYALRGDTLRLFFAVAATLIMVWYGVDSFLRARKISRS